MNSKVKDSLIEKLTILTFLDLLFLLITLLTKITLNLFGKTLYPCQSI